jgi:hemerythrin-like metal-binding protein
MHKFQDPGIDAEHDLIISCFEAMLEIVSTHDYDSQQRKACVDMFRHYTTSHFRHEEKAMAAVNYPHMQDHVLAHAYLQKEVRSLVGLMREDRPNHAADLAAFRKMFLFHILTHDEAYGEWLAQQPQAASPVEEQAQA